MHVNSRVRTLLTGIGAACLLFAPQIALAHERFIPHTPKYPMDERYFQSFFHNPDMMSIIGRTTALMAIMMFIWFLRNPLDHFVEDKLLANLTGKPKEIVHLIACFVTDKPVEHPWFKTLGEWFVVMFLRVPALVLMFAAANNSLVMTSYPLEPSTLFFFQFAQVIMGIGMLTQTFLPLGGASIVGTFIYLLTAYDWKAAVDVLPVLTVAVCYICAPWDSWKKQITTIPRPQMKWVRLILGFGFFVLGFMKIYNYYLTIGVADNFPSVMNDPMITMFSFGTSTLHFRENWIMAFSAAEILTGFLLMVGVFSRVWCLLMVYIFAKLMIVDFGWNEIPHLYPIGAFLVVVFSNTLSDEFYFVEKKEENYERAGKTFLEVLYAAGAAIVVAVIAVFPMTYLLAHVPHPPYFPNAQVQSAERQMDAYGTKGAQGAQQFHDNMMKQLGVAKASGPDGAMSNMVGM